MASKSWSKPTGFGVLPIAMPTPASKTSKPHREISFNGCRKEGEPQNLRTSDFKRRRRNKKTPKLIVECFKMFARIFWSEKSGGNGRDTCKVGIVKWMYLTESRGFCANCWGAQCLTVMCQVLLCLQWSSACIELASIKSTNPKSQACSPQHQPAVVWMFRTAIFLPSGPSTSTISAPLWIALHSNHACLAKEKCSLLPTWSSSINWSLKLRRSAEIVCSPSKPASP